MNNKYSNNKIVTQSLKIDDNPFSGLSDVDITKKLIKDYVRFFQPIVDLQSKEIVKQEVLLRKNNKENSTAFHDIAKLEKMGKIGLLDLSNVMHVSHLISKNKTDIPIAINISAKSFEDQTFVDYLISAAKRTQGKDGSNLLAVELTETEMVKSTDKLNAVFNKLKTFGVNISADDYSSGFMDMNLVKSLDFDTVKIDGDLVLKYADGDASAKSQIEEVVSYAKRRGMQVIAERANGNSISDLRDMGVDFGQSFDLGMPVDEVHRTKDHKEKSYAYSL